MPLMNQVTGEQVQPEQQPSEDRVQQRRDRNTEIVKKAEQDQLLNSLKSYIESCLRVQKQTQMMLDEVLKHQTPILDEATLETVAAKLAAEAANKFDVYCERILKQRVDDALRRLEQAHSVAENGSPQPRKKSRWLFRKHHDP